MSTRIRHWIDGAELDEATARSGPVFDPATGQQTGSVDLASPATVDHAVTAARVAFDDWRHASLSRRTRVLFAFRELLAAKQDELAATISAEHGKVLADARGEVARGLEVAELACGIPQLLTGGHSVDISTRVDAYSIREPLGLSVIVSPFNFPVMVPMWFHPIAIAAGNAVIVKPSERDPSASNLVARMWQDAGLPAGVFTVLHGDRETVEALLVHPGVDSVSFVGSTPVARSVHETATSHGKRVQALGGAKNHLLVLPDADLDLAADAAVNAGFGSAGERCMAISVVVAVDPIGDDLVERIATRARSVRTGDGRRDVDMGPLVSREHLQRVTGYVERGVAEGGRLVTDGRDVQVDGSPAGFWLGPTLFDHVSPQMSIYQDEIFGPVLCVVRVGSYDEGLALINANPYGNGAAVFTNDGGAARRFQTDVQVGMVGINVPIPVPVAWYSFGGRKASLFGDTHAYGADGVHFFTRGKVVTARWLDPSHGGLDLGFPAGS